jgi:DNA polymerase
MTREPLHLDIETRSEVDLKIYGAYVYFAHPSTDILCAAYAFGDTGEPEIWLPNQPCPDAIMEHVKAGGQIVAWNAAFERQGWNSILAPRYGWALPKIEQFMCTMAETLAMNLPGKLEDAAPALGLDIRKDDAGHRLMLSMCKPRKPRKDEPANALLWRESDDEKQRLYEYCKQDVRTEQAVGTRVLRLRPEEARIFHLDAKINDRGVFIDQTLCHYAKAVVNVEMDRLNEKMKAVTGGEVGAATNVQQLVQYLEKNGIKTKTVAKDAITDLLILDIPDKCRAALEIRQEAAKTSTAKIDAMLKRRNADGRMRGNVQYHGAGTGRWAARGAQLQNLPRPMLIKGDGEEFSKNYDFAISNIMVGSNVLLEMLYDRPLTVIADCLRGMITAAPGNELIAADFSNIEGRDTAWLAGQDDKIEAFKAFDDGTGADLYLIAASGVYGVPVKEAKPFRQVGKVCELALGFQGGAGAFANMAKNYGLKVGTLFEGIWDRATDSVRDKAEAGWAQRGKRSGMAEEAWLAAELIKLAWRQKNHCIVDYWKQLNDAALDAFENQGQTITAGKVKYRVHGSFLWCRLPSGRALCYPYPRLEAMINAEHPDGFQETMTREEAMKLGLPVVGKARSRLVYKSVDQWTRKFKEKPFYGGLAMENIAQAVARDIMAEAMIRLEDAGYPVVLTVHDEVISEKPKGYGSLEEFNKIMTVLPTWAEGLPISASGWQGQRYRKG